MSRYIETTAEANTARAKLQDLRNQVIAYQKEAVVEDRDLAHWEASVLTEKTATALVGITELEYELVDWQRRWPDEHGPDDCAGECERDHDEDRADSLAEMRWEQERDVA